MLTRVGRIIFCPSGIRKYAINVAQIIKNASSHKYESGRAEYSTDRISLPAIGSDNTVAKRNIHFINVITEYLDINGLNTPRYIEKHSELRIIRITPKGLVCCTALSPLTALTIRYNTPIKLIKTPPAFFSVIGSLRTIAAIIIVLIGVMELIIEQSIGVILDIPKRKVS